MTHAIAIYLMRYILIFLLISGIALCQEEIRFKDGPMMREHHAHQAPNDLNLTVHLIPHSHDDVGWLKTVDNYFYGGNQDTQWAGVQYTIDTVVSELTTNPEYRFVIVEVAFLYRWWKNANETQKAQMKKLVENGQLEFINGGWCMSDEATPYYEDVVDQMSLGLRWLKDTFNFVPDVAWHIDPFGHQASSASMFSKMGFQSFFFARIDYQDKQQRMSEKSLQMLWKPKLTVPDSSNYIFTHVNYYHYSPPPGFCFDLLCKNDPIKDDEDLEDYNLVAKAQELVLYFKSQSVHFRSSHLMHTLGEDFHYANARMWFKNIDKLIKFINARPEFGVKLIYSTPSKYIKQIQSESNKYPSKTDDFFPYADYQHAYWTGYFTSRPAVKGFVRDFGRWLQATRKLVSEAKMRGDSSTILSEAKQLESRIWELETSMGILQHHDAVSGTEKQKVADDYIATALRSLAKFAPLYKKILKELISKDTGETVNENNVFINMFWNETANATGVANSIQNGKTVLVSLYNPGAAATRQVKIHVPPKDLKVSGWSNEQIHGDVICGNTYDVNNCQLILNLAFPESGCVYLKLAGEAKSPTAKVVKLKELTVLDSAKEFKLAGSTSIKITKSSLKFDLNLGDRVESFFLNYNYYESYAAGGQKSGAYIFRPANDTAKKYSTVKAIHYAEGVENVVIVLEGDRVNSKLYFSKKEGAVNEQGFEIESRVEAIPVTDKIGKEVTLNFASGLSNNKTFYTDSNGLEEQIRVVDYRPTWPLVVNEAVAGNYYPINSHIGIQDTDSKRKLTILTDRSQGGTVIKNGEIEIMIHRRTLEDDARGVGEPLNEAGVEGKGLIQNIRHYVVFGDNYRKVQLANDQKVSISLVQSASPTFAKHNPTSVAFPVPSGVKLYLRPFADGSYLLRLQNFNLNAATVSVPSGWSTTELTLAANQLQSDWEKAQYKWNSEPTQNVDEDLRRERLKIAEQSILERGLKKISQWLGFESSRENLQAEPIKLNYLQIRTFKLIKS